MPLIEQLVYEQATQECRAAITPRKNKGLQDWLKVCCELGGPLTNAGLAATILQGQKRPDMAELKLCYNCGKPGHLKKNCRALVKRRAPGLCTKCGKGYHWARDCRSVKAPAARTSSSSRERGHSKKRVSGSQVSGPQNIWDPGRQQVNPTVHRATEGSAGLDLRATTRFMLMPQMGVQPIPTDYKGPLPPGSVSLILGQASLTLQGLIVHPGVVNQDYEGELQVFCSCPQGVFSISQGDRIAQLIILPSLHGCFPSSGVPRAARRIGSTGNDSAYLIMPLDSRPSLELVIEGKQFKGILDTGADKSIVSSHWWPKAWPVTQSSHSLQGLSYQSCPTISSRSLSWQAPEGQMRRFTLYVLPLPVNLWGRDILQAMGMTLTNEYSPQAVQIMKKMGYKEGRGLGKGEQGRLEYIPQEGNNGRQGLGFI
jgi:dUTPase